MNKQKTNKPSIGIYTLYVLGAIACFAFFQFCYPYHLFYQEQNQLFLMSWDHVTTYLDKPGWLACLAGDFLTQFYYFRYAGPIILTLCILLTGYNIRCAVEMADIKGRWVAHSVAFIVMILLVCFSFHYDYRLSSILAVAGGASVFRVSTSLLISTRMFIKSIQSAPIPSITRDVRITKPVSRTMPPTFGADMASCIRPRCDSEMRRPDKSEKDAPTVITPRPPI